MIAVLRDKEVGQHRRCGPTARRRQGRSRGLGDRIAGLAGVLRPHVADHLEPPRHIVQHLGDVLAEQGHAAATVRADAGLVTVRLMDNLLARKVVGQRLAFGLGRLTGCRLASNSLTRTASSVSNSSS